MFFSIYSGCKSELLEQAASDYFPIDRDCIWYYETDGDTLEVYGGEKKEIASREAIILSTGTCKEFFYKGDEEIDWLIYRPVRAGDDVDTVFIWTYFLPDQLISGDEWSETYTFTNTIFGDEILFSADVWGRIVDRSGDLCEIERSTSITFISDYFGTEYDTIISHEWYRRDIGITRLILDDGGLGEREYNLIDYNFTE